VAHRIGHRVGTFVTTAVLLAGTLAPLPAQQPVPPVPEIKSPVVAFMFSLAGSVVPLALIRDNSDSGPGLALLSVLLGPALGHLYAGEPGRAFAGVGVRAGIALLTALTARGASGGCFESDDICFPATLVVGAIAEGVAMVVDIVTAPHSASLYNARAKRVGVYLSPLPAGADGHGRLGIGMQVRLP
jgi:hypothetical protein